MAGDEPEITLARFPDFGELGRAWRELEQQAGEVPFFRTWTWLGCLAEERFPDPVVIRASAGGRTIGLALFNRRGRTLHLGETGEAERDAVYVEHNGPLVAADAPEGLAGRMLAAAWDLAGARRMVLSGAPEGLAAAAGGLVLSERRQPAPFVDLAALSAGGGDFLASRSRNTRAQIRRSIRHFEGRWGALHLSRPSGPGEACVWLEEMIGLHAASWERRGRPGAFASAFMRRFHAALVAEAAGRGELDLVRLIAGGETLGLLYGFRHRGVVYAYQSGFRSFPGEPDARPGLVAHALAIEAARAAGLARYDFLAGDARYKRSLATGEVMLAWTRLVRPSLAGLAEAGLRRVVSKLRARVAGRH